MKKITLLVLVVILVFSCNNDDGGTVISEKGATDIDIVTGLVLRQGPNDAPIVLGNPNERKFSESGLDLFVAYPNPAINAITIRSSDNTAIENIWIARGIVNKNFATVDYEKAFEGATYALSELDRVNIIDDLKLEGQTVYTIDLTELQEGHYRVFIKTVKGVEWQNIVVLRSGADAFNDLLKFWEYQS